MYLHQEPRVLENNCFMKQILFLLFSLCTVISFSGISDSTGTISKKGQKYVVHKVEKGETFYSISKRYHTSVNVVKKANDGLEKLSIGAMLHIPYTETTTPKKAEFQNIHVVGPHETLYSISRKYGVLLSDLKKWNDLTSSAISPGNKLIIKTERPSSVHNEKSVMKTHEVSAGETLYSIARKYEVSVADIRESNDLTPTSTISIGQKIAIPETHRVPNEVKKEETLTSNKAMIKVGDNKVFSKNRAQCLHMTAPKGTIVKVVHDANTTPIYLLVVGNIEDQNSHAALIINKKAQERIGFSEKITYARVSLVE